MFLLLTWVLIVANIPTTEYRSREKFCLLRGREGLDRPKQLASEYG